MNKINNITIFGIAFLIFILIGVYFNYNKSIEYAKSGLQECEVYDKFGNIGSVWKKECK